MGVSRGSVPIVSSVHISSVHVSSVHISLAPSEPLMNIMFVHAPPQGAASARALLGEHEFLATPWPNKGTACSTRTTAW